MNSAPAELLHLLDDAALQRAASNPASPRQRRWRRIPLKEAAPDLQGCAGLMPCARVAFIQRMSTASRWRVTFPVAGTCSSLAKKNAGNNAGASMLLQKGQLIFRRIRCHPRDDRERERFEKSLIWSDTVHQVRLPPFR